MCVCVDFSDVKCSYLKSFCFVVRDLLMSRLGQSSILEQRTSNWAVFQMENSRVLEARQKKKGKLLCIHLFLLFMFDSVLFLLSFFGFSPQATWFWACDAHFIPLFLSFSSILFNRASPFFCACHSPTLSPFLPLSPSLFHHWGHVGHAVHDRTQFSDVVLYLFSTCGFWWEKEVANERGRERTVQMWLNTTS